ncbi:3-dehydroquinate synthase [Chloroflexus sp.]|uniref:3-dehydroquinate synthase n=1 Tax=Chloroflexus sp. TaxID=1904827 RepID=UPI00298EFA7C|nr:3-dehydroquinate synthase [Chloroflexus sp.]MDW8403398.1 3-dehydroquinate synthase [Chloroflexus sp.]
MTTTLTVTTSTTQYPVVVGAGVLATLADRLAALGLRGTLWLVADEHLAAVAEQTTTTLRAAGYCAHAITVPSGEHSKSFAELHRLYDWMIGNGIERRDAVLALGGGVIGDLAGFAAATVLRGVALVQLPSTLLAMVDAAVGGKTGINHPLGKNLIGAFHQPRLVLADTNLLATLPSRELRAGWAEVIKHGVIRDAGLFTALEDLAAARGWHAANPASWDANNAELTAQLTDVIARAVAVKVEVVSIDEFERGERITLNYGHTIGHAIEQLLGYRLLHGECVAIGMDAAARIAVALGLCPPELVERQRALLAAYGLSTTMPSDLDRAAILALITRDKKVQAGKVRWVLPTAIGQVIVRSDVPVDVIETVLSP